MDNVLMKQKTRSSCPICYCLDIFGDRWTLLILRDILIRQKRSYQEFLNSGEGIATNVLADRLKTLLENDFITKTDNPEDKRQPHYFPTKKAVALLPVLEEMVKWGFQFGVKTKEPFLKRLVENPESVKRALREIYKKEFKELEK